MGELPPHALGQDDWPECIDLAGLPYSVFGGTGALCGHSVNPNYRAHCGRSNLGRRPFVVPAGGLKLDRS